MRLTAKSIFSPRSNDEEMNRKIKKLLPISDYDWAQEFKSQIINHPNTVEVRNIIKDIPIEDLRKYYDIILKKISNPLEELNEYVYKLRLLIQKAKSISHNTINIGSYVIENKNDIQALEDSFNIYYFFLFQEDSPLLMITEDKYDKIAFEILNDAGYDEGLKAVYLQERKNLNDYLTLDFWFNYHNFLVRKANFHNREHDAYYQTFETRVYQHRYYGYYGPKK